MIKINLLPFRAARKKENVRRQISVFVLSIVFFVLAMAYFWLDFNGTIKGLASEQTRKKKELETYSATIKKIQKIEKKIELLQSKLSVIRGLERNKTGPVRLLDEISMAVPRGKLWLSSLSEKKGLVKMTGTAKDNDSVAEFMTNLENSEQIDSVDLGSARLKPIKEYDKDVVDFIISCKVAAPEPEPVETAKKAKGDKKGKSKKKAGKKD